MDLKRSVIFWHLEEAFRMTYPCHGPSISTLDGETNLGANVSNRIGHLSSSFSQCL
jgi:hypothetical protein